MVVYWWRSADESDVDESGGPMVGYLRSRYMGNQKGQQVRGSGSGRCIRTINYEAKCVLETGVSCWAPPGGRMVVEKS